MVLVDKIVEHKRLHGCSDLYFKNMKILGVYGDMIFNSMEGVRRLWKLRTAIFLMIIRNRETT